MSRRVSKRRIAAEAATAPVIVSLPNGRWIRFGKNEYWKIAIFMATAGARDPRHLSAAFWRDLGKGPPRISGEGLLVRARLNDSSRAQGRKRYRMIGAPTPRRFCAGANAVGRIDAEGRVICRAR